MKTDNHIDTVLRSVMERRAERIPALSDDFALQVMNKMNARKESAKGHRRFAAVFSIAAVLFIAFILWPENHKTPIMETESQPFTAEVSSREVSYMLQVKPSQNISSPEELLPQQPPAVHPVTHIQQKELIVAACNQPEQEVSLMEAAQADLDIQKRVQAIETATQAQAEQAFEVAVAAVLCSREPS